MSRNEHFEAGSAPRDKYVVFTRDKNGDSLYLNPDTDDPQRTEYDTAKEALNHVGRTGMAWRYDHDNGVFKRAKIDHYTVHTQFPDGRLHPQSEHYPAGWQRGDAR
jgi:hypothetical protein